MLIADSDKKNGYLSWITLGNELPDGRPKAFFACYPSDFERYFDTVKEMIFKHQSYCAIWYENKDSVIGREELLSYLEDMQLVVIPVTLDFLTKENRARDIVTGFAYERHIPVLPLLMDGGLKEIFYEKFPGKEYLNPYDHDMTKIPFEKKLERFLEDVFVGEETAQRVRDAFDAYVFLSYRKKDREYARELMRLIHSNEELRDIAIWYDEYLRPGEGFHEAIRKALVKGDLFALLVTPSLIERKDGKANFIMREEYPEALKAKKRILPVLMKDTDRKTLETEFPDLPKCVAGHNAHQLRESFIESLSRAAKRENDPEHDFLIGLAYLDGIDVEVNFETALRLISDAAKAGVPEAMKKLSAMYSEGKGVERNIEKATLWLERCIEKMLEAWKNTGDAEILDGIISEKIDLQDLYQKNGRIDAAFKIYEEIIELSKGSSYDTAEFLYLVYLDMGGLESQKGNTKKAAEYYERAFKALEGSDLDKDSIEYREALLNYYCLYSEVLFASEDRYIRHLDKTIKLAREIANEKHTIASRLCLAQILVLKAGYIGMLWHFREAEELIIEAQKLLEALAGETKTIKSRDCLYNSYSRLSYLYREQGRYKEAGETYEKEIDLAKRLAEETGFLYHRKWLADAYCESGKMDVEIGEYERAGECFYKAEGILIEDSRNSNNLSERDALSKLYIDLGDLEEKQGQYDKALIWYQKSFELKKEISDKSEGLLFISDIPYLYENIGRIYYKTGEIEKGREYFDAAIELCEDYYCGKDSTLFLSELKVAYKKYGDMEFSSGNNEYAKDLYEKALDITKTYSQNLGAIITQIDIADIYVHLGDIESAQGDLEKAIDLYEKARSLYNEVSDREETPKVLINIFNVCKKLGEIHEKNGKKYYRASLENEEKEEYEKAGEYYEKCFTILDKINSINPGKYDIEFITVCKDFGGVCVHLDKYGKAEEYYRKGLEIAKGVGFPNREKKIIALGAIYNLIAMACDLQDKESEAEEHFISSIGIFEEGKDLDSESIQTNLANVYDSYGDLLYYSGRLQMALDYYSKEQLILEGLNERNPGRYQEEIAKCKEMIDRVHQKMGE